MIILRVTLIILVRNLLIILWLILIGVIAVPVCLDYMNGTPKDDVLSVIQRETETDDIRVTLEEEIGNKAMYCFQTGSDFGAAVFSRMGERYCYQESTLETERNTLTCGWTRAGMCTSIT